MARLHRPDLFRSEREEQAKGTGRYRPSYVLGCTIFWRCAHDTLLYQQHDGSYHAVYIEALFHVLSSARLVLY